MAIVLVIILVIVGLPKNLNEITVSEDSTLSENTTNIENEETKENCEVSENIGISEYNEVSDNSISQDDIDAGTRTLVGDIDEDGEPEIFLNFDPMVNSMPLMEYVVLKKNGDIWQPLEMIHGEELLDNSFLIHIKYGEAPCILDISCDGYDDVITYDFTTHYEKLLASSEPGDSFYTSFQNVLSGAGYEKGVEYGGVLAWRIWNISVTTYEGQNCLVAEHGLGGLEGKYDMLGTLNVYFRYTGEGKVEIVNLELVPEE